MTNLLEKIAAAKEEADASSDAIDKIRALVEEGGNLQTTIESLLEAYKMAVGRFNRIKMYELPKIMKDKGVGKFDTIDGKIKTKFESYVSGSLPKEEFEREQAFKVLEEAGGGPLIKTEVIVHFPKSQHNIAKDFYVRAQALLKEYDPENEIEFDPTFKEGVHSATLQKFAKEALKEGKELDWEKLGLSVGNHVKFEFYDEDPATGKMKKRKKVTLEVGTGGDGDEG